jgi:hypothetical protein
MAGWPRISKVSPRVGGAPCRGSYSIGHSLAGQRYDLGSDNIPIYPLKESRSSRISIMIVARAIVGRKLRSSRRSAARSSLILLCRLSPLRFPRESLPPYRRLCRCPRRPCKRKSSPHTSRQWWASRARRSPIPRPARSQAVRFRKLREFSDWQCRKSHDHCSVRYPLSTWSRAAIPKFPPARGLIQAIDTVSVILDKAGHPSGHRMDSFLKSD